MQTAVVASDGHVYNQHDLACCKPKLVGPQNLEYAMGEPHLQPVVQEVVVSRALQDMILSIAVHRQQQQRGSAAVA